MLPYLRRFAVPGVFLVAFCVVSSVYAALSPEAQRSMVAATATNLANLRSDPLGTLVASAFVSEGGPWQWVPFAAAGLFPLTHRLGGARALLLIVAAHVIGTVVSEGLLAWRISTGAEPRSLRFLDDVGPSYVVTAALVATILYGSARPGGGLRVFQTSLWWRLTALVGLVVLSPYIFTGLGRLGVAAVGHVVALTVGAAGGLLLTWRRTAPAAPEAPSADRL